MAGFDSAVGPAFSVFETVRQLNIGILPVKWGRRVSLEANTGCWRWLGFIDSEGYGKVSHKGRTYKVHRLIYSFVFDDIGTAPVLDHRCHEADKACRGGKTCLHRRCVNPLHLMPTSAADNTLEEGVGNRSSIARRIVFTGMLSPKRIQFLSDEAAVNARRADVLPNESGT